MITAVRLDWLLREAIVQGGLDTHILHPCQGVRIALPGNDGTQDLLARLTPHIRDHVGQLNVHLHQRLLHVLNVPGLQPQQHGTLAAQ